MIAPCRVGGGGPCGRVGSDETTSCNAGAEGGAPALRGEILEWARPDPKFALPRYIALRGELPKNPSAACFNSSSQEGVTARLGVRRRPPSSYNRSALARALTEEVRGIASTLV